MAFDYEGPDIRVLWNKTPKAQRIHQCDRCGEAIEPGSVYESLGIIEDGVFIASKLHRWAYQYPSGCPRYRAADIADMEKYDAPLSPNGEAVSACTSEDETARDEPPLYISREEGNSSSQSLPSAENSNAEPSAS